MNFLRYSGRAFWRGATALETLWSVVVFALFLVGIAAPAALDFGPDWLPIVIGAVGLVLIALVGGYRLWSEAERTSVALGEAAADAQREARATEEAARAAADLADAQRQQVYEARQARAIDHGAEFRRELGLQGRSGGFNVNTQNIGRARADVVEAILVLADGSELKPSQTSSKIVQPGDDFRVRFAADRPPQGSKVTLVISYRDAGHDEQQVFRSTVEFSLPPTG